MIQKLKSLLGMGPRVDFVKLVKEGATIVDVRTKAEFQEGHLQGSINIPLQTLGANLNKVSKSKPVIMCCASGMRSASARNFLRSKGFTAVYNGGGWRNLKSKIGK